MHGSVPFGVASASVVAAESCRETNLPIDPGNILPPVKWFMRLVHGLWPTKPTAWLRSFTGFPERTCRSAANGETDPSGAMLYVLLRGDAGEAILSGIMEGAPSDWFRKMQRASRIAAAVDRVR